MRPYQHLPDVRRSDRLSAELDELKRKSLKTKPKARSKCPAILRAKVKDQLQQHPTVTGIGPIRLILDRDAPDDEDDGEDDGEQEDDEDLSDVDEWIREDAP